MIIISSTCFCYTKIMSTADLIVSDAPTRVDLGSFGYYLRIGVEK